MDKILTSNGRLIDELLPAVYFDSSVSIDYWITEGIKDSNDEMVDLTDRLWGPVVDVMRNLLKTDSRVKKVAEIRKRLEQKSVKTQPVVSELVLWELQEWIAEANFKQAGAEISGAIFLQRKGKKDIGNYLKKVYELWQDEGEDGHDHPKTGTSGLEMIMQSSWVNLGYANYHGLCNILFAPIKNFCWPPKLAKNRNPFSDPYMLAFLQLGVADILHILIANHLGCKYIASFDSDFKRAKPFVEATGMKVLCSPEEILAIL